MELQEQFIQENNLTPEQASAINGFYSESIAGLKKEWDTKANDNAEKILEGAAGAVSKLTGFQRQQGQKIADFISEAGNSYVSGLKTELEAKKKELEDSINSGSKDEELKNQYESLKTKYDESLKKAAEYDKWAEADYKGSLEDLQNKYSSLKQRLAFADVRPKFPETVNEYEAKAKWGEFENEILNGYDIDFDDKDSPIAVSKENPHLKVSLKELVNKNESITTLLKEDKPQGLGSKVDKVAIEGVPFKIKKGANPSERTQAIKDYLASQGLEPHSSGYAKQFSDLNNKILGKDSLN